MSDNEQADRHDADTAVHDTAIADQQTEEAEFHDAGYNETLPGQIEVTAGSVQHTQLLNAYPNATSYGPTHNVVVPEPEEPPVEIPPEDSPPEEGV